MQKVCSMWQNGFGHTCWPMNNNTVLCFAITWLEGSSAAKSTGSLPALGFCTQVYTTRLKWQLSCLPLWNPLDRILLRAVKPRLRPSPTKKTAPTAPLCAVAQLFSCWMEMENSTSTTGCVSVCAVGVANRGIQQYKQLPKKNTQKIQKQGVGEKTGLHSANC